MFNVTFVPNHTIRKKCFWIFKMLSYVHVLKVVTNEKGEAVGEVLTIMC